MGSAIKETRLTLNTHSRACWSIGVQKLVQAIADIFQKAQETEHSSRLKWTALTLTMKMETMVEVLLDEAGTESTCPMICLYGSRSSLILRCAMWPTVSKDPGTSHPSGKSLATHCRANLVNFHIKKNKCNFFFLLIFIFLAFSHQIN